jgi:hypothetical protein
MLLEWFFKVYRGHGDLKKHQCATTRPFGRVGWCCFQATMKCLSHTKCSVHARLHTYVPLCWIGCMLRDRRRHVALPPLALSTHTHTHTHTHPHTHTHTHTHSAFIYIYVYIYPTCSKAKSLLRCLERSVTASTA